jgi:hypothetical protein
MINAIHNIQTMNSRIIKLKIVFSINNKEIVRVQKLKKINNKLFYQRQKQLKILI